MDTYVSRTLGDLFAAIGYKFKALLYCTATRRTRIEQLSIWIEEAKAAIEDFHAENGWMLNDDMRLFMKGLASQAECEGMATMVGEARGRVRAMEMCVEALEEWAGFVGKIDEPFEEVVEEEWVGDKVESKSCYLLSEVQEDGRCYACGK